MKIVLASDHAGLELKNMLVQWLTKNNYQVLDVGAKELNQDDSYVKYAKLGAKKMTKKSDMAIFICGSGVGMSICANRVAGLRAGGFTSISGVVTARRHNNLNVLCLGARVISPVKAKKLVVAFLETHFEGGRHAKRVAQIDK